MAKRGGAISLTVHRNTVEKRRKRELAQGLSRRTADMIRSADIRAYAVVGIASDGSGHAIWDTGGVVPMWAFTDVVAGLLRRDIENNIDQIAEDWRPPVNNRDRERT